MNRALLLAFGGICVVALVEFIQKFARINGNPVNLSGFLFIGIAIFIAGLIWKVAGSRQK